MSYESDHGDGDDDLAQWDQLYRTWNGRAEDRIRVVLGRHATDTAGPDLLREVRRKSCDLGCCITMHVGQSRAELEFLQAAYRKSPVE